MRNSDDSRGRGEEIPNLETKDGVIAGIDEGFKVIVWILGFLAVSVLVAIAIVISGQATPAIAKFGTGFVLGKDWDVPNELFGALPYIYGTLVSSAISLVLALPVGVAVAIITSEDILPNWIRSPLGFIVELLAAIPSVVIGLWGIFVLIPFIKPLSSWLHQTLSWIPLFGTEPFGPGLFPAGVILAIMIIPTISSISRDVLLSAPQELKSASRGLGATRWETILKLLLPAASSGILGATLLGLGRSLGETMAVTMVIGNNPQISASLFDLAATIPSVLANEFAEAQEGLHVSSLMYLAVILFFITLLVNVAAVFLVRILGIKAAKA